MQCHSCGEEVREGQKFCMECGASLRGVADVTGEVPITRRQPVTAVPDDRTAEMAATTAMPPPRSMVSTKPPSPPTGPEADRSVVDTVPVESMAGPFTITTTPAPLNVLTGEVSSPDAALRTDELPTDPQPPPATGAQRRLEAAEPTARRRFRLRPMLVVAVLAAAATVTGVLTTVVEITPPPTGSTPAYMVNDFGTNNTIAALIAAGTMVVGALAWCRGYRWGAGLAGGAGAALAGWVALLVGLAEWQMSTAELAGAAVSRSTGYWALVGAGATGVVVLVISLVRAGGDGRAGLDPWIAALGAVSVLIAAGGPLIPEGSADWSGNWSSDTLGVDLPTMFFAGRLVQIGLVALCGVVGFLLVRRYGLGLAIGAAVSAGWMLATAATGQTTSPIGPAYENPGSIDLEPHAVTVVGFALLGFFALVAVVMALLDADR
ncbi:MAG: zinc-ribbon domain-containing protein [Ilumatobacteraceae bacterium]